MFHMLSLAQHLYGFEGRTAQYVFMAGFIGLVIVAALVMKISFKYWLIAGVLFATALTAPTDELQTRYLETWMLPVQLQRATIHLSIGVLLTLIMIVEGGIPSRLIPGPSVLLFAICLLAGTLQFIHENDAMIAIQSIGFALGTIPCMIAVCGNLTRDYEGCLRMVRVFMWVSVIWTFCCSVQFIINPELLVNNTGRFWGMLGNAQQAAVTCAPFATIAMWLLMNDPQRRAKVLWLALTAINVIFVIWTGSRTGALMLIVGMTGVLYARLDKAVLLLPLAGVVFWALYGLSDSLQIGANLERFVSGENTRGWVWEAQLQTALENPLIGAGLLNNGGSESSYLGSFAAYGIGMFLLVLATLFVTMWCCLKLFKARRILPPHQRAMVDLYNAFFAMYFVGAAFEGYILARSGATSVMFLMFAGIGKYLLTCVEEAEANADLPQASAEEMAYGEHAEGEHAPGMAH